MSYARIDSHIADSLARLTSAYSQANNVRGLVTVFAGQVQRIEDALWAVAQGQLHKGGVLGAAQLDALGRIVGQDRDGLDNATYTALLLGQVGVNTSDATVSAIAFVAKTLFEAQAVFVATPNAPVSAPDFAPAAVQIGLGSPGVAPALHGRLLGVLRQALGAGVTLSNVVIFDAQSALAPQGPQPWALGFGALDGTGGGKLADLISSSN